MRRELTVFAWDWTSDATVNAVTMSCRMVDPAALHSLIVPVPDGVVAFANNLHEALLPGNDSQ